MIVIPAVDLRGGRCVQLVGGSYEREMVSLDDAESAAKRWESEGFKAIHVVDLDAATGRGSNALLVERIIQSANVEVQVGGGLRTSEQVARALEVGAARVVVGTRALEDREWLEEITAKYPDRIIVAADVRDRTVLVRGWQTSREVSLEKEIAALNDLPLAGLLVTAVHREGLMEGPDAPLIGEVARLSAFPIQASGGIGTMEDLDALADAGASAAVIGMALYTGALSTAQINRGTGV